MPQPRQLDFEHPTIAADLIAPEQPHSAIAIIVEALRRRMASGRPAFTVLSCDNIQHNGNVLRRAVLQFAERRNASLARWIEANTRFPNTMVDRITPVTRAEAIADLTDASWHRRRLAGVLRNVPAMGDRRRFRAGAAAMGTCRRAVRPGRNALRIHEAALAQHQPPRDRRVGAARRLHLHRRNDARRPVASLHAGADGSRDGANAAAGARHRPATLQDDADRTIRELRHQGHGGARQHRRAPQRARRSHS